MKIILATRNRKKTEEIRRILAGTPLSLINLEAFPTCPDVIEDGATFQENAEKKARQVAAFTQHPALADDSGLVVDALRGAPGVYSARYAGVDATDAGNLAALLRDLRDLPRPSRNDGSPTHHGAAHFACVLSLAHPNGRVRSFFGRVDGHIVDPPRGDNGFGYDPVFVPVGWQHTFAEATAEQKDALSHRGHALAAFSEALKTATRNNTMEELFGS